MGDTMQPTYRNLYADYYQAGMSGPRIPGAKLDNEAVQKPARCMHQVWQRRMGAI